MCERQQRGLEIAATKNLTPKGEVWLVPSQSGKGRYTVCPKSEHCSCPDHETRGVRCKHLFAVEYTISRNADGSTTETLKLTYSQDWRAYNAAQTSEKATLQSLLHDLCKGIPESTATKMGRPRLPLRDGIFCACFKVYSMFSGRRFMSDLRDAHEKGYISRVPHFNSVLKVFDTAGTTPILEALVRESATPMTAIEENFAIDSTGFSGCRYDRWYEHKWRNAQPLTKRVWVKAHAVIGVTTNVVTAAEVLDKDSHDSRSLLPLMDATAERFKINDLCADKAYLSEGSLQAIIDRGATPLIPFKVNSVATRPGVWNNAYHFFSLHREEFLTRYHQRSNVESTFSMVKRKFGDSVRAKNDQSMKNEALAKFVCHNLCCLIQSMEEFGIDPSFRKVAC
jgi:transposase